MSSLFVTWVSDIDLESRIQQCSTSYLAAADPQVSAPPAEQSLLFDDQVDDSLGDVVDA